MSWSGDKSLVKYVHFWIDISNIFHSLGGFGKIRHVEQIESYNFTPVFIEYLQCARYLKFNEISLANFASQTKSSEDKMSAVGI